MQPQVSKKEVKASELLQADLILYSGTIDRPYDDQLFELCGDRKRRENVILILETSGGNADAAYRIARCLQQKYKKFSVFVPGYCKSAGTIVTVGAHEIVMRDNAEIGPLDVQIAQDDELWKYNSGLNIAEALESMKFNSFQMFEEYFLELNRKSGGKISLKTCTQLATNLTVGLYGKVYEQIDPMRLGEVARAMQIAVQYARRLARKSRNLKSDKVVDILAAQYPTHGFVIDRQEAGELFKNVREANEIEESVFRKIKGECDLSKQTVVRFIDEVTLESKEENPRGTGNGFTG